MRFSGFRKGNIICNLANHRTSFIFKENRDYKVIATTLDHKKEVSFNASVLRSVPLTIDRLKRFRFTLVNECYVYNNCWVKPQSNGFFYVEFGKTRDRIDSVHELQNLYHHEIGEDLPLPDFNKVAPNENGVY